MKPYPLCLAGVTLALAAAVAFTEESKLPLLYETTFDKGADDWQPTEKDTWKVAEVDGNKVYSQYTRKDTYKPPFRSPFHISLLKDVIASDFELKLRVRSTVADYGHRDVCLFFGYQDPSHFYYVHLGKVADPNSCQVMIVDKAPRKAITKKTAKGIGWDDKWHDVRIVRTVDDGTIEVYFDDMKTPVLTAEDKTFAWGQVGMGTFDDTADFDDVKLWGKKAERPINR